MKVLLLILCINRYIYTLLILLIGLVSIGASYVNNRTNLDHVNKRNLINFECINNLNLYNFCIVPTFTFDSSKLNFNTNGSSVYVDGYLYITDDSNCKFGESMQDSLHFRYYFRPSGMDYIGMKDPDVHRHYIGYCFRSATFELSIPEFHQVDKSYTVFTFALYTDSGYSIRLGLHEITVGCERIIEENVIYDYTVINGRGEGKCVDFYYTTKKLIRECQSNGQWKKITNDMKCYPQTPPNIKPSASNLSLSFNSDKSKIILSGKIILKDQTSECPESHYESITYFYSLTHAEGYLPQKNVKNQTIPFCFENNEVIFDFEVENNDVSYEWFIISIFGNEDQQRLNKSVSYYLKCNEVRQYNAYWPEGYIGERRGICNILHIWNNNNNSSRSDYPIRKCYPNREWEELSEGCVRFQPTINFDYNETISFFNENNDTIVSGKLYVEYISECSLINETITPIFYMKISSLELPNIITTYEVNSCLLSNRSYITISDYNASKLYTKLCYDKDCKNVLKDNETHIFSCPFIVQNNVHYKPTIAGDYINITSADCSYFHSYGNGLYNKTSFIRKCDGVLGWEETDEICSPDTTNFRFDLSDISPSLDNNYYLSLNGTIKIIDGNRCNYSSKPNSLFIIYEISDKNTINPTSSNGINKIIPYCFDNNEYYIIPLNNLKSKYSNNFNLNIKLCTSETECSGVNLLSEISKPFGCKDVTHNNYIFSSSLVGEQTGKCKNFHEYTLEPPIRGKCNENGSWSYPEGECKLDKKYIELLIDIDLSDLKARINGQKLTLDGNIRLRDRYGCNSTYKPNQLKISYKLSREKYDYGDETVTVKYCLNNSEYNIELDDYDSNEINGVNFNIKVYTNDGIVVGSNSRVFGCKSEETDKKIIWPIALFGNVTGECVPLYEFEIENAVPQRECKTDGKWNDYDKKCELKSNFTIDTSLLDVSVSTDHRSVIKGIIKVEDLNKGIATYLPNTVSFVYYYSDSSNSHEMSHKHKDSSYPFSNNHIESYDYSTNPYEAENKGTWADFDQLNMKLCLNEFCKHKYIEKSQIVVCKYTNTDTVIWNKTVVNTNSIGECIHFYYYPKNNSHILPPRKCKEGGIWDSFNEVCVLMNFPKFAVNVIDASSTIHHLNNYDLRFKAKLILSVHEDIPYYGEIRLLCKLGNENGINDNNGYSDCGIINYKNENQVGISSYITKELKLTNSNNEENYYLYLKLCINEKNKDSNTACRYKIQDVSKFYLKCAATSGSNATWEESLVNTAIKGECNRKYVYKGEGDVPKRSCSVDGTWNEPEDICVRQTNPIFSYSWKKFKSSNLKNDSVEFEGILEVKDDSNGLKYQKVIYYRYYFMKSANVYGEVKYGKQSYSFSGNKLEIAIDKRKLNNYKFYFYIEFCTNEYCDDNGDSDSEKNEIISSYNKTLICIRDDLSSTEFHMVWENTLPGTTAVTECSSNPDHSYYNGVDEIPTRKCDNYGEWEELIYQCVVNVSLCERDEYVHNYFPLSPSPRVYHSPCKDGFHNLVPAGSILYNKARRNCTGDGIWSEIENPCFSDDYKKLKLITDGINTTKIANEFCVDGMLAVEFNNNYYIRKNDSYFMTIQINYQLNNDVQSIDHFKFTNTSVGQFKHSYLNKVCFKNTNKIKFFLYFEDENLRISEKTLTIGCLGMKYERTNFDLTANFGKNYGYCDEGYISEGTPTAHCLGSWVDIKNSCFFPDFRYYYLNLSNIFVTVNETHFILSKSFTIEHNRSCDPIVYSVKLEVYRINLSPIEGSKSLYYEKNHTCINNKVIATVEINGNNLPIKSTVANTISFGLYYSTESIMDATRVLGCPNYIYRHNIFSTSLFGEKIGKCDEDYISQSPNGLPSNICNENGEWNSGDLIKYPCFKPTYKDTEFSFSELVIEPKETEFCLSGKLVTEYLKNACGDVETPFNLTIYYKFKNIDNNIYHYLDSFIYHCQERISETVYTSPVCVLSNETNEITYQLRYGDEIITTSSLVLGCDRKSELHNNFNTSLVGENIEGSCDDEYISESISGRPIRECKENGEWHDDIKYVCVPTDYRYLLFDSSKSIIIIKDKTNFCLTNDLRVVYNRTICSDIYHPVNINIMYQYANETVNNTINTNNIHYFSQFLFNCRYGVVFEENYPIDFCISSKASTFVKFVMMYGDEIITSHNIYLGCDELKDVGNKFDTSLIGKTEGKCGNGFMSLSPNGNPERECQADGTWSEVKYPCIRDDYSLLRFNLQNLVITLNSKQEFCINGDLLSKYEGECDKYNYNLIIKLYYQLNGTGVENYYQDFIFDCRNGNYSLSRFKADLCVDSSLYNKIKFHLYYTNTHITDSLLYLGCMRERVNGSEWEASLIGKSSGVCLSGYTTLNSNISRPIRECLYDGRYGAIIEPCVEIPSNEGFLTGAVKYAVFGISILLLLICLLLLCCCLLCYACNRTKKKHDKRIRNEGNIDVDNNENNNDNDNDEEENNNNNNNNRRNNNEDNNEDEDNCKENCGGGTNVIFNDKNDIESVDGLNGSISGGSNNNIKKGILKKTSSKFGKKSSASSLVNNGNNNNYNKKPSATMYTMRANQLHPSKSSTFVNKSDSNENNNSKPLRHFKSSHNVLRSNSKISPSLPGSTSDNMDDNDNKLISLGRTKSVTSSSGFNPTFTTSNIGLSNPSIPTNAAIGRSSSNNNYNPRFTSATLGLSNPSSVVNSDNEESDNELLIGSTSSLKKSNANMNENIPPKYVLNKRQSINRSVSSAFPPPPPQAQIQPPPPSSSKTIRHYSVRGSGPVRSVSCRIPKRVNKAECVSENHPFGIGSPLKRSKSTLFRENKKSEVNSGLPVRQISKKNSSKALELDLDVEDII